MGNSIVQYRVSIGPFYSRYNSYVRFCSKRQKYSPTKRVFSKKVIRNLGKIVLSLLVMIPIFFYLIAEILNCDSVQCSVQPGQPSSSRTGIYSDSFCILTMFLFKMVTNFENRYLFGNRRISGIKISHWNKGRSLLRNKMIEVRNIINDVHLHILGLSEANLHQDHDLDLVQLPDYDLHLPLTYSNPDICCSRVVAYTHKSIVARPRHDLMSSTCSSIWLEVGLPRQKKFLVCQMYREWQLLNVNLEYASNSIDHQMARWLHATCSQYRFRSPCCGRC